MLPLSTEIYHRRLLVFPMLSPSCVFTNQTSLLHYINFLWTAHWPAAVQLLVSVSFVKSNLLRGFYEAAFNALGWSQSHRAYGDKFKFRWKQRRRPDTFEIWVVLKCKLCFDLTEGEQLLFFFFYSHRVSGLMFPLITLVLTLSWHSPSFSFCFSALCLFFLPIQYSIACFVILSLLWLFKLQLLNERHPKLFVIDCRQHDCWMRMYRQS